MKNYHIFLAEDDLIIAMDIKCTLQKMGFNNVSIFTDANELFKKASENPPDLIITNRLLKNNSDGLHSVEELWKNFDVPFLFISAENLNSLISKYKDHKLAFIPKPFNEDDLMLTVNKLLYKL